MFIQLIQGKTSDADALKAQFDKWADELGKGAEGFLGSTAGVSDDGDVVVLARFESEESARANSERPEQGAWWEETARHFEGEVTFRDTTDVKTFLDGGSDDAQFVQVMQGRVRDRGRLESLQDELVQRMEEERPEILGMVQAWDGDLLTQVAYFASEHTAREGEGKALEPEMMDRLEALRSLFEDLTYIDISEPWLLTPPSDDEEEDGS